jgi:hypothetical protein
MLKQTWNFITGKSNLNLKDTYYWNEQEDEKKTSSKLGTLSAKYESSGKSTTINPGTWDKTGGKSYGAYQFAGRISSTGKWVSGYSPQKNEVQGFINWLGKQKGGADMAKKLSTAKAKDGNKYGKNFDNAWRTVASTSAFKNLEHSYAVASWFTPAANSISKAIGDKNLLVKLGPVLQDVLWSTAIQHGQGGATNIFKSVLKPGWEKQPKSKIIDQIYAKRSTYLSKLSSSVRAGVLKRYANEKADAKRMLG